MTDFGGVEEYTTWDGEPVSRERPHGATVVVAARSPRGWRYVLLHRGHHGPDWEGDWASVDGTEHDRFEWVSYAEACGRCRPAELAATFVTACPALGSR
jgi:hypothetical protein